MIIILSARKQLPGEKLEKWTIGSIHKTVSIETRRFPNSPWMPCCRETFVPIETRREEGTLETFATGTWFFLKPITKALRFETGLHRERHSGESLARVHEKIMH